MIRKANVALIEDDIYADLGYAPVRPRACRSYDDVPSAAQQRDGLRRLLQNRRPQPAHRLVHSRQMDQTMSSRMKAWLNIAAPTLPQLALAQFMENGGYERHLRKVTAIYHRQVERMSELMAEHFPAETRITRPQGGFLLWAELPESRSIRSTSTTARFKRHLHLPRRRLLRHRQISKLRANQLRTALDAAGGAGDPLLFTAGEVDWPDLHAEAA
jgi:DNA-binding transcriptional MocR family regulator